MIITSLSSSGEYAWTGGWDGHVRRWKLVGDQLVSDGELSLGACINAVQAVEDGAYVAVAGGKLVRVVAA